MEAEILRGQMGNGKRKRDRESVQWICGCVIANIEANIRSSYLETICMGKLQEETVELPGRLVCEW